MNHSEVTISRKAIGSLALSLCLGPIGAIPAIVLGHLAKRDIRRNPNLKGVGLAIAGLIIGYLFAAFIALCVGLFALVKITGGA